MKRCKICKKKLPIENPHWKKCDRPQCNKYKMKKYKATKHSWNKYGWICDCDEVGGYIYDADTHFCIKCCAIQSDVMIREKYRVSQKSAYLFSHKKTTQ